MTSCAARVLAGVVLVLTVTASSDAPTAMTTYGPIIGVTTPTGSAFLGVPFASPPQRWAAPVPPESWTSPRNATQHALDCILFTNDSRPTSEDCLYLDVYVPAIRAAGAPLIVYIHGGGFVNGGATCNFWAKECTDFSQYANDTGAVVVSIAYRLGALGFLALPGMSPAFPVPSNSSAVPNVGLLDQQAALLWTKANAAAFGGDPGHILLTGESAGGGSVLFHLTMPGSYATYRAAMAQSPSERISAPTPHTPPRTRT
jgi:para-nitrobenzyl esterase